MTVVCMAVRVVAPRRAHPASVATSPCGVRLRRVLQILGTAAALAHPASGQLVGGFGHTIGYVGNWPGQRLGITGTMPTEHVAIHMDFKFGDTRTGRATDTPPFVYGTTLDGKPIYVQSRDTGSRNSSVDIALSAAMRGQWSAYVGAGLGMNQKWREYKDIKGATPGRPRARSSATTQIRTHGFSEK